MVVINQPAMGGALASISSMGKSMSEVIVDGAATAKMASAENEQSKGLFRIVYTSCLKKYNHVLQQ